MARFSFNRTAAEPNRLVVTDPADEGPPPADAAPDAAPTPRLDLSFAPDQDDAPAAGP